MTCPVAPGGCDTTTRLLSSPPSVQSVLRRLAISAFLVTFTACAANPVRPDCGGWRVALANAGTFGMYGLKCHDYMVAYEDGQRIKAIRDAHIDRCVQQGGDPAACRAAVYAPREPTRITVNAVAPAPALPMPTYVGPRNAFGVPVGAVPVFPVR
jgi:hypothetical protein